MPSRPTDRILTPSHQTSPPHRKRRRPVSITNDQLIRQLKLQDALLKRAPEQPLPSYVEPAWPMLGHHESLNTPRGHMLAASIGGSITGKGGSRIVVDDPHNPMQAESDAQREAAVNYFSRTLSTRLDNKRDDAIVVVMQRLHERDLAAL